MRQDILVVTATLGNRDSLEKTVQSVAQIGGSRVKHVLIAPDNKCELLNIRYPHLEIIAEPESCKGIYMALNFALLKFANDYEYLTFINDDDYWLTGYANLIDYLEKNKEVDVAYGRVKYVNANGDFIGIQTCSSRYKAFKALLSEGIVLFTQQAVLMRVKVFLQIGGFDEKLKLVADTKFWLDAINSGYKFHYINCQCAAYTLQEGQLSSDGKLQELEHKTLDLTFNRNDFKNVIIEKVLFRIQNLNVYFGRFFKNKNITRMKDMFNQN